MQKFLRSIQTLFPFLHDTRFSLKMKMIAWTKKPHELDFVAVKQFKPKSDEVFVDIGSNRGEAISSMRATASSQIKIIGFEPNPHIFKKLKKLFKEDQNIELHNCGLGNTSTTLPLYIPFYRKWLFDGLSSFKYYEAENWLRTRLWAYNDHKLSIKEVACEIKRLDDFELKPYFIKIDVQGYEMEALQGSKNTLKAYQPILLIESITDEIERYLRGFGYEFYCFCKGKLSLGKGSLNTYCIGPEKAQELNLNYLNNNGKTEAFKDKKQNAQAQ